MTFNKAADANLDSESSSTTVDGGKNWPFTPELRTCGIRGLAVKARGVQAEISQQTLPTLALEAQAFIAVKSLKERLVFLTLYRHATTSSCRLLTVPLARIAQAAKQRILPLQLFSLRGHDSFMFIRLLCTYFYVSSQICVLCPLLAILDTPRTEIGHRPREETKIEKFIPCALCA